MAIRPFKREKVAFTEENIISRRRRSKKRTLIVAFFITLEALILGYLGISFFVATQMVYAQPKAITETPAALGLNYRNVTFLSREDHLLLRGWFMPGVLPDGQLTTERTIIMAHGLHDNREALDGGLLKLSADLVHKGFAILVFDFRGHGQSTPAPLSMGYYEQRDVLGAVDFLRSGPMPYPDLGRPKAIGGWGISVGGDALIYAAAQEPAIQAIVVDSAYATMAEYMEPAFGKFFIFIPGARYSEMMLYGLDYTDIRPVDVIARIAPRPVFLIQGAADIAIVPSNMTQLAAAAESAPDAHVQTWLVPNSNHIQAYHRMENTYVDRLVTFFNTELNIKSDSV